MNKKITTISLAISTIFLLVLIVSFTKSKQDNFQEPKDPKITNLKLLVALLVVQEVLNGPGFAVDERVDGLQVRGVGQHGEASLLPSRLAPSSLSTSQVKSQLHVAEG